MTAGVLRFRLAFDRRADVDDGAGGLEGDFVEQFRLAAELMPKLGGETVLAARLVGQATFVLRVRSSSLSRQVTPDWRARDVRSAADPDKQTVYAILSGPIDVEYGKNRYLEFLLQTGKAP
ncbi:head-tail adaptor [Bradyrhizobium japonicum]|uniref:head-tail adaptor protein n=1 Tax=Bradyrhizobium elkanii TaxID=29448 RepID=UPI00035C3007|nr:head-tail adaptor protein [Bradyrhizobium elkanii]WAX24351.1 head-tail adaptor protein [Bradyrhizobium phage ppBeUSDA76-1]MCP1731272.1 head-tail adaptor [Bradyrhizobium elkanii]MCS3575401.1 head-tail adaptor [Bradyrhizobium elkanii]MCS3591908.1 head-tail adaptor [Bradyrhizobium elkanii]MCS3621353.1 head-tail adaptor [Bradyrhizobium elkanii]